MNSQVSSGQRDVSILFKAPVGDPSGRHERTITDLPTPVATQMVRDFSTFRQSGTEEERYQMYTYGGEGSEENVLAVDFGDVATIVVLYSRFM